MENKQENDEPEKCLIFSKKIIEESKQLIQETDPLCIDYSKFMVTGESEYSSLMPLQGKQATDIITQHIGPVSHILDATAHIGCDSVNFVRRLGAEVISVEQDKEAYDCLVINRITFDYEKAIYPVHGNCVEFIKDFKPRMDFVYFDPPWGGPLYWKQKKMMLYLGHDGKKLPIYDVINSTLKEGFTDTVVLKTPSNFDIKTFSKKFNGKWKSYKVMKPKKSTSRRAYPAFYLIICRK